MKKSFRRLLGVVLAMAMILSMSLSAFAATNDTISVKINISYRTVTFTDTSVIKGDKQTVSTTIDVTDTDNSVETAVRTAIASGTWEDAAGNIVTVAGKDGTKVNADETTTPVVNGWVQAEDYYTPGKFHSALDRLEINGSLYKTDVQDTTAEWRGAGWTYSGSDGINNFNTNNYMDDNFILTDDAHVDLVFDSYVYPK